MLMLSYPSDEVGNELVSWDKLDDAGVDPYTDVLTLARYALLACGCMAVGCGVHALLTAKREGKKR